MISDANKAVNDLASIVPLLGGSSSRKDYEEARKLVEYLLEHDPDSPLVDIQQLGFSQSDFENEIGNKSLVSRILSGERSLTLDHMRALANRFQIPVSMFVD